MTMSDILDWHTYIAVRGPIGLARWDGYVRAILTALGAAPVLPWEVDPAAGPRLVQTIGDAPEESLAS